MKTLLKLTLVLLPFTFYSCQKEIYGCTDSTAGNYSTLANKDDGSCYFPDPAAVSTTVTISNWTQSGNDWVTTIPYGEITGDVVDNGAVVVYKENGTNTWNSLPLTVYNSVSYSTTIEVTITVGQVIITWTNSDGSLPSNPDENVYKISVIS